MTESVPRLSDENIALLAARMRQLARSTKTVRPLRRLTEVDDTLRKLDD